jgi:hypothetical protein
MDLVSDAAQSLVPSGVSAASLSATTGTEPTVLALSRDVDPHSTPLVDPNATPVEPSTGAGPAGVPSGLLALLSPAEIAMFVVLALLVFAAIATAIFALTR